MLKIQTIIDGNHPEIVQFFDSVAPIASKIIVVNLGATKETLDVCSRYNVKIICSDASNGYSVALNNTMDDKGYYLFMWPWEQFVQGSLDTLSERAYNATIIKEYTFVKEIRIWNKESGIRFKNYVCPTLDTKTNHFCNCFISSKRTNVNYELLQEWSRKEPLNNKILYYKAACLLSMGKYDEFLVHSHQYMEMMKKPTIAATMNRYYFAMVKSMREENVAAVQNLILCLSVNPLMAEFWCLLGDIYYHIKKYDFAKAFYENGLILGGRRLNNDLWPMDISKYEEYPKKMLESCDKIINNRQIYKVNEIVQRMEE